MILKRNGSKVEFDKSRIVIAIIKAMRETEMGIDLGVANRIADSIEGIYLDTKDYLTLTVEEIQNLVEDGLVENDRMDVCKKYIIYRENRRKIRENTTDEGILSLVSFDNKDLMMENSNKNPVLNSTQRDLIAGEVSKDIFDRYYLPQHLVKAHNDGIIHIHDKDYMLHPMTNCSILNLKDMLDNGTVINDKQIRTPNSFRVACTITTQILAQVTSAQWGGVSINGIDRILAPYARKSYNKYYQKHLERLNDMGIDNAKEVAEKYADEDVKKEVVDGVQTIQYQINTLNNIGA